MFRHKTTATHNVKEIVRDVTTQGLRAASDHFEEAAALGFRQRSKPLHSLHAGWNSIPAQTRRQLSTRARGGIVDWFQIVSTKYLCTCKPNFILLRGAMLVRSPCLYRSMRDISAGGS